MSLVKTESFDAYNSVNGLFASGWSWVGGFGANVGLTTGRFGGQCMYTDSQVFANYPVTLSFPSSYSSFSVGFAFKCDAFMITRAIVAFGQSGNMQCGLAMTTAGELFVGRFTSISNCVETFATSNPLTIRAGVWHYIEIECVISDTGSMNVYVDGKNVLTTTGDTQNLLVNTVNQLNWLSPIQVGGNRHYFDDLYIANTATRLGECKVEVLRPIADFSTAWTPDTGTTNYTRVNESVLDTSNYVSTNTVGARDLYSFPSLSVLPYAIYGVSVNSVARKNDAGTRVINNTIHSGSTDADGDDHYLATSDMVFETIYETDPATSASWTASAVNALKAGPKLKS